MSSVNKKKIINDPVFGFIKIPSDFHYDIIQHPYFQRLNRIKQLGLTSLVYPGAQHTRLQHSLGAMHLMGEAVKQLKEKGQKITEEEEEAVLSAILLHDIGHGPFSHTLENILIYSLSHEEISSMMMERINQEKKGRLDLAISIFKNTYHKGFLSQLLSGQLDMDRLDYLRRDSFYSGVSEGNIGSARIIKMLNVKDDQLVVEAKGIYSIEQFIIARRLMYWQVYLHKTSVAAEKMLINIFKRARYLAEKGVELFTTPALHYFLYNVIDKEKFQKDEKALHYFTSLDDTDLMCCIKVWAGHSDKILSLLSESFINRRLFKIKITEETVTEKEVDEKLREYQNRFSISKEEAKYLVFSDRIISDTYRVEEDNINILYNDGEVKDLARASDMLDLTVLSKQVEKYFFCYYP